VVNVALYSVQPILSAGFETVLAKMAGFQMSGVCTSAVRLVEHIQSEHPDLILIEMTPEITLEMLKRVTAAAGRSPVILWVETVSTEFAAQVLGLGVRGILRRNLPVELLMKCLEKVVAGELWLEKGLTDRLLSSKRVVVTPRQRELMFLLAQGRKNKEIAHLLGVTEGSVKVYLSNLFQKLGVNDRFELALFALKNFGMDQSGESAAPAPDRTPQQETCPIPEFLPAFISMDRVEAGIP
jgi:two-component system, NarL family, nitrate/nitrite response regulator NarL